MRKPAILLSLLALPFAHAQTAQPDGVIVPFTSGLPVCASYCGPLFDVQGACGPPKLAAVDNNCFCTDSRLTIFDSAGTTGVSNVCGKASPFSCTSQADLQAIITWYDSYCGEKKTTTTTTTAAGGAVTTSTSTPKAGSSNTNQTWLQGHWKWVVMLVIIFFSIVAAWITAYLLRRRYIKKREKEIEMKPPVAWGPHQLQGMTGGYNYGDGVSEANRGGKSAQVNEKGAAAMATPAVIEKAQKRESKGLKKKVRT